MADIIRRKPVTLHRNATVQEACKLMHDERIGAVLVINEHGALEGIFTGRDVVRLLADGKNAAQTRLHTVMTHNPDHLPPHHNAIDALRVMHDGGFRHIPVVDHGRIVGIVSHGDFRSFEHAQHDEETGIWERI